MVAVIASPLKPEARITPFHPALKLEAVLKY
jgi:hypothetical protein